MDIPEYFKETNPERTAALISQESRCRAVFY